MPDKKYLIEIPGQEGVAYWGEERYMKNRDALLKDHPDAIIAEVGAYSADDVKDNDMYLIDVPGQEGSAYWDSTRFNANRDALLKDHPNARIQRVRGIDYWGEQRADIERRMEEHDNMYGQFLSDYETKKEQSRLRNMSTETFRNDADYDYVLEHAAEYAKRNKERESLRKEHYNNPSVKAEREEDLIAVKDMSAKLQEETDNRYKEAIANYQAEGGNIAARGADKVISEKAETQMYASAINMLQKAQETLETPSKYDESNGFVNFMKGAGHTFGSADFWSAGLTEIQDNVKARAAFDRLKEELGTTDISKLNEEQIDKALSPAEKAMVLAFTRKALADYKRSEDMSLGYQSGKSAAESLGFMAQFLLTGSVTNVAAKGATSGMAKWLATNLGNAFVKQAGSTAARFGAKALQQAGKFALGTTRSLVDAAVRTGMTTTLARSISEQALPNIYEGTLPQANEYVLKGLGDAFIENWSEAYGGVLGKMVSTPASALFGKWGQVIARSPMMKGLERAGFNGYLSEIGEEWFGNAMRTLTKVNPDALKDFATVDNQIVTATSFLPMSLIGGGVSIGQYKFAGKDLENKAAELRVALQNAGLNMDEIDALVDYTQQLSPSMLSERFTPIINRLARSSSGNAASVMRTATNFAKAVARYQALEGGYQVEENNAKNEYRDQLQQQMNGEQFWTTRELNASNEQGEAYTEDEVRVATLLDGSRVFILGQEGDQIQYVDEQGNRNFMSESDIPNMVAEDRTMSLDQFLSEDVIARRSEQEALRMAEERAVQINDIKAAHPIGSVVNLGTRVNPMEGVIVGYQPGYAMVQTSDNQVQGVSYDTLAQAFNSPIRVLTDEQIASEEAALLESQNAERETEVAETPEEMDGADLSVESAVELEEEAAPVIIPQNEDGSVDEAKFLEDNPEAYVEWNDAERQDGGADSMEQLQMLIPVYQAQYDQATKEWAASAANPVARRSAKDAMAEWQDKINRINNLLSKYASPSEQEVTNTADRTIQSELEDLHDGTLNEAEIASNIDAHINEAQNALNEYAKNAPEMGTDRKAYRQAKAEYEEGLTTLQQELDYWNAVKAANEKYGQVMSNEELGRLEAERVAVLKDRVNEWQEKLGVEIETIERVEDIDDPEALADMAEGGKPMGWTNIKTGKVVLVLPHNDSVQMIDETIIHEVVSHKGLRGLLGQKDFDKLCDRVFKGMSQEDKQFYLNYANVNGDSRKAADEYIAHLAEKVNVLNDSDVSVWRKIVDFVKEALRAIGINVSYSDQELSDLIKRSYVRLNENAQSESVAELEENGFEVDQENGDVRFSSRYTTTPQDAERIINDIVSVTGRDRATAERWLQSETSLTSIVLADKQYLDYDPDAKYSAIKSNSDYPQGTVDFNNICRKRLPFTQMYTRLQRRFPNRIFTAEELADIRSIMSEDGLMVACGLCYVEDRRQMLGEVANAFINDLKDGFRTYATGSGKKQEAAANLLIMVGSDNYVPTIYDLITLEGSDKLYEEHRGIWDAFGAYNRLRGQQTQNTFQGYAEYKREILGWSSAKVKKVNSLGGLRIFSYSDFEAHHLLDIVQIIIDCAAKGVMIQGYTKVPEFARAVANTGIKLNRSLIPLGDTGIVDGKLAYDMVEGIDINDPNFLEANDNVGNILIGINAEQIRLAMADPFVDYIIPYHARQAGKIRAKLNVGAWENYIDTQNERVKETGKRVSDNINIYTDILGPDVTNDREFVEKYLAKCEELGRIPKFDEFLDVDENGKYVYTPGYYKFLVDFKLFDKDGNILPQKPVVAEFDDAFNMQILNDYAEGERQTTGVQMNETYDKIVSALGLDESQAEGNDVMFKSTRKSPNTVLPGEESPFKGTVVSSDSVANIIKEIDSAIEKYQNSNNDPRGFVSNMARLLRLTPAGPSSYASFTAINGTVFTLRMSDHNATVSNFDNVGENYGISIVVSRKPNTGLINDGEAGVAEFFYSDKKLNKAEGKPLVEIAKSIKQMFYSGQYKDTTGLAETESANLFRTRITPEQDKAYMKAPNGKDSKLTPEQWALVRTKNFKQWFGDWENDPANASKVVDENGEPMVVYHGTDKDFNVFDIRTDPHKSFTWKIAHFGTKEQAEDILRTSKGAKRLMEVFLNIRNPYRISDQEDNDSWRYAAKQAANGMFADQNGVKADGLVYLNEYEGKVPADSYAVWNPSQIKSATDNTGEFSAGNNDIRFRAKYDTNTNPTEAQKKAGNYKMGHIRLDGYNITIENPKGSVRRGTDSKGNAWENTLSNDYGYIRGTEGVDGDHIDVYLSDNPTEGNVFVIDQVNPETREFDEHKVMYGFDSAEEAREAYLANFSEGWNGLGTITEVSKDEFKKWIESSHRKTKPFSEYKSVRANEMQATDESDLRYRVVTNQETLDRLNSEPTIKVYRAMQVIDGKLYPPMSAKVDGKLREPIELGQWEEAEERPDLADEKGNFKLDKGNKTSVPARYNPYFHTSRTPLNDQFSSAQTRPNLVTVEVEVPESELTSGYKAEKAKDSVGEKEWKAGIIQGKLSGTRKVILSRWDKPVRIVPDSEVAERIVEMFDGRDITMPSNVVTPSLRTELEKLGVPFIETNNQGKPIESTQFRTTGTPTEQVVNDGLPLSVEEFTNLAADIFSALPEKMRREVVENASRDNYNLKKAIFQLSTSLAEKKNLSEDEIELAKMVAQKVEDAVIASGMEMTRPFTTNEALWMLYQSTNPTSEYNLIGNARKAVVADNLGFSKNAQNQEKRDESEVMFRRTYVPEQAVSAADAYTQAISYYGNRLNEAFVDQFDAVDHLMKAIEDATGKKAETWEDIRLVLNQSASKGLAKLKEVERDLIQKMWDAVNELAKAGVTQERLARYVILKHGLERNETFAARDARNFYEAEYRDELKRIKNDSTLTDAEKDQKRDDAKKVLDDHLLDIQNKVDDKYLENRKTDYSGIKAMFADYPGLMSEDNYSTAEEYKTAKRKARVLKYKKLSDAEAQAEMECDAFEVGRDNLIKGLWNSINNLTKGTLKMQYEYGMLSKDAYQSLTGMFKYYVPLRGFADNTGEDLYDYYGHNVSDGYAPAVMGAKGRKSEAESPFGWMAAMAATAVVSGEKNLAKQALYWFAVNRKANDLLKVADVWYVESQSEPGKFYPEYPPKADPNKTPAENAQQYTDWEQQMEDLAKQGKAVKKANRLSVEGVANFGRLDAPEHVIKVNIAGEEKQLIVNANPRAAQAINGLLNIESNPDYQKVLGKVLRWMSQVSTGWNPEFWMTNISRDTITAFSAIHIKEDKAYNEAFRRNWADAWKIVKLLPKLKDGTLGNGKLEDLLREAVENGVQTGYSHIKAMEEWDKEMGQYLKDLNKDEKAIVRGTKNFIDKIQNLSESMELVSRFATYITSREMGRDIIQSVSDAKEVTVNFNRKGSGMRITFDEAKKLKWADGKPIFSEKWTGLRRMMGLASVAYVSGASALAPFGRKFMMFFNAGVQGLNMWLQLIRRGHGKQIGTMAGSAFALGILNSVVAGMLDGDDDDYQQSISDYERRTNLMLGANGYYLKIALPQELRGFYGLGDILYNYMAGNYHHKDKPMEIIRAVSGQLFEMLPINPMGGWQEFIPQIGKATVEAGLAIPFFGEVIKGTNMNFAGIPLRDEKPWLSEDEKQSLPKYTFAGEGTWNWLVRTAELANKVTGGTEYDAGWLQLDPARIQHYIKQATGGVGTFVGNVLSTISASIDPEKDVEISNIPFLNKMLTVADERGQNKLINQQYYYYKGVSERSEMRLDKYQAAEDRKNAKKEKNSTDYKIAKIFRKYEARQDSYTERMKRARGSKEEKELKMKRDANRKEFLNELAEKGLL